MLINVIGNGVDVEGTNYESIWEALLQGIVHACSATVTKPMV